MADQAVRPKQSPNLPSKWTISTDSTNPVFTLQPGEVGFIQNLGTTALAVAYGEVASPTNFNYLLKAGVAAADGMGGFTTVDDFIGVVYVKEMSGSPSFIAWKRAIG